MTINLLIVDQQAMYIIIVQIVYSCTFTHVPKHLQFDSMNKKKRKKILTCFEKELLMSFCLSQIMAPITNHISITITN